jgi:hypothetical protein
VEWDSTDGFLVQVSVGEAGVWGVSRWDGIYYRENTYGDPRDIGTEWIRLKGTGDFFFKVNVKINPTLFQGCG